MIVGLDDWKEEDAQWFADLNIRWTKLAVGEVDTGEIDEPNRDQMEAAAAAGMTVVCDLRPTSQLQRELPGMLGDKDPVRITDALARLRDGVAVVVGELGHLCERWEWWGEFDCPAVGGVWPRKEAAYPGLIRAVHDGIRLAQPHGQVWNGGYGVNFQPQFITHGLAVEAPDAFTHANWHHYNISDYWPRDRKGRFVYNAPLEERIADSADKFRQMFEATRATMTERGCAQPFVSSEWGMPIVSDEAAKEPGAVQLWSAVFDEETKLDVLQGHPMFYEFRDGVHGISDTQGAQFFEAWMQVFEEVGFEVLIYHRLHDTTLLGPDGDGTFWGLFCGLLYKDGSPKTAMIEAFRKWVERGAA